MKRLVIERHGVSDGWYRREQAERTGQLMEAAYDQRTDTLTLVLQEGVAVAESDEDKPGVILDYDAEGNLVSLEVLVASTRVSETNRIELEMLG